MILPPLGRVAVPTGLAVALPDGYEAQVRPRSGLALNDGVTVLNSPGTIDADYRGEIKVILINLSHRPFAIERGQRIAQLIVAPVVQIDWHEVHVLETTDRGDGGHGSTGSM
jgi:dUTP pyrophosphatase